MTIKTYLVAAAATVSLAACGGASDAPTIEDAVTALAADGFDRIDVVTSMMTPGGFHSETDIPAALERARARHPEVALRYLWPFDMHAVAGLLASHLGA